MLRSIAVVMLSYVLSIMLVLASDPLLSLWFPGQFAKGSIPSDPALIASTVLFVLISIFCAVVCAYFARRPRSRHVLWFFVLGEAMGMAATIANWGNGWPHWYAIAWLVTWPVSCGLGLALVERVNSRRTSAA